MLTVKEAASRLGLSEKTVYTLIAQGEIEGYKFGKAVRVEQDALDRYKARCRIQPPPQERRVDIRTARKLSARREQEVQARGYTGLDCLRRAR